MLAEKLLTNEQDCRAWGQEQWALSISPWSKNHRARVGRSSRPRRRLESKRSPLVGPRQRKINETLETVAARQASFNCRLNDIWRKESERHGHPDRSLGLAFARCKRLQSLAGVGQKFVQPAVGVAKGFDQDRARVSAHRTPIRTGLKIDPNNTDALAGGAYTYVLERGYGINPETDSDDKILGPTDRAIALAPDTGWAYYVKGVYLYYSHRADKAIAAADAGLAINPNFPLWGVRGNANLFAGRFEQAKSDIQQAIRLSPHDPLVFYSRKYLGDAEVGLGNSTPPSKTTAGRSTSASTICGLTRVWQPHLRSQARWTMRNPR